MLLFLSFFIHYLILALLLTYLFISVLCTFSPGVSSSEVFPMKSDIAVNPLTPNDPYRGRTAPLTSKRCILYIYSTNIGTEYLNMVYTLRYFRFKMQSVS